MIRYTLQRLLQFIPSFIIITFLGFLLSDYAPVDPAERLTGRTIDAGKPLTGEQRDNMLREYRHKLGLDLPMFYISVHSMAECDTLERIPDRGERDSTRLAIITSSPPSQNYIPSISFHANNRYHQWLFGNGETTKGVLRGDFGLSYTSGQPVSVIISQRIGYTLFFSLGSILLAYLISIPLGVYAAVKKNSWFDRTSSVVLFLLYSMPSFWLATLLLMAFANPDVLYWFEASGVKPAQGYPDGAGIFEKLCISLPYLVLPMICYTYSSLAFLSRTLRVSVLEQIKQDYITTARAKGLPDNKVVWKHAFRNALLPLITVLANVFPYAIGGSVILETVFTIPGLGFETYRAIIGQDYPVIMAMVTLTSVLTMLGLLVQDVLYALADPRISFNHRKR